MKTLLLMVSLVVVFPCWAENHLTEQLQQQVDQFLARRLPYDMTEGVLYGHGGSVDLFGDLFIPRNDEKIVRAS